MFSMLIGSRELIAVALLAICLGLKFDQLAKIAAPAYLLKEWSLQYCRDRQSTQSIPISEKEINHGVPKFELEQFSSDMTFTRHCRLNRCMAFGQCPHACTNFEVQILDIFSPLTIFTF